MPTYLLACDRQNSPVDGVGFPGRSYTAYGEIPSPIGPMTGFCGQPRDVRMGRYPLGKGHRRYNPVLMRFHEPDALSPFDKGGINAYAYCGADPINRNDPTGRIPGAVMLVASAIQHTLGVTWTWRTWPQGGKLAVASALSKKTGHALLMTALTLKVAGAPGAQELSLAGVVALGTASALKHRELTLKNRANERFAGQPQSHENRAGLLGPNGELDHELQEVVSEHPARNPITTTDTSNKSSDIRAGEEKV